MLRTPRPTRLDLHQRVPQLSQQRRRPLAPLDAQRFDEPLRQTIRIRGVLVVTSERLRDDSRTSATDVIVQHSLLFTDRIVRGDIRLRGRSHIEQQLPRTLSVHLATPQVERPDLGQFRLQDDRHRTRLFRLALFEDRPNRWQGPDPLGIDRDEIARLVRQPDARHIQRELNWLRHEQLELPLR